MINANVLKASGVSCELADKWGLRFSTDLVEHDIIGVERESCFLGQVLHESGYLRSTKENLNYSVGGLLKTFPRYFTPDQADGYARQPERIANRVYADRMGNGDEASGDGWRYRGNGFIQLTGHNNHRAYKLWSGDSATTLDPLLSAIYYWVNNELNYFADKGDVKGATKRINGGYNGLEDRIAKTGRVKRALEAV